MFDDRSQMEIRASYVRTLAKEAQTPLRKSLDAAREKAKQSSNRQDDNFFSQGCELANHDRHINILEAQLNMFSVVEEMAEMAMHSSPPMMTVTLKWLNGLILAARDNRPDDAKDQPSVFTS
jgi:hypothetical protein